MSRPSRIAMRSSPFGLRTSTGNASKNSLAKMMIGASGAKALCRSLPCGTLRLRSGQASKVVPSRIGCGTAGVVPSPIRCGRTEVVPSHDDPTVQMRISERTGKGTISMLPQRIGEGTTPAVPQPIREGTTLEACPERSRRVPQGSDLQRALAPDAPIIIFANEFFDALPVEVLSPKGELRIAIRDGRLIETWAPASSEELEFLDRYSVHPENEERVEVPLQMQSYMSEIAAALKHGIIIVIDYGYTREEQLAGRHRGTVTAFRQHSVSANPYEAPGEQDITAHVNFTALAAAAEQNGMQVQALLTQSQFLMGIGEQNQFADAFEDCRLAQDRAKVALQLKHLVTPAGMGESFHVLVATKGIDADRSSTLLGLNFSKKC